MLINDNIQYSSFCGNPLQKKRSNYFSIDKQGRIVKHFLIKDNGDIVSNTAEFDVDRIERNREFAHANRHFVNIWGHLTNNSKQGKVGDPYVECIGFFNEFAADNAYRNILSLDGIDRNKAIASLLDDEAIELYS